MPMDPDVEEELCRRIAQDVAPSIRRMWLNLQGWAQEHGHPKPTYWQVYRFVNEVPAERLAAYRNGSRSAVADTMHHPPVPADYTHHVWSLDEMEVPVWIRSYDRRARMWIAIVVALVLIICNRSRAIVGYHVADPKRRGKKSGFDSDNVLAALLSAMLPELAPPSCQQYAGYRPEVLQWDKAAQHEAMLETVEKSGIYVPDLPGRTPYPRGKVERPVDTLKALCSEIRGYKRKWLPLTDKVTKNPKATRSESVATSFRETTKIPIEVEDLHTYEALCEEIDRKVMRVYNEVETHRILGTTPEIGYHENFDRALARSGRDALYILEPDTGVSTKGILSHRNVEFYLESQGREVPHGTQVRFRPDPLLRGVFIEAFGEDDLFCMPSEQWARQHNATDVARDRGAKARDYSAEGEAAREELRREEIGQEGAQRADGELDRLTAPADQQWEAAQKRKRNRKDATQLALDLTRSAPIATTAPTAAETAAVPEPGVDKPATPATQKSASKKSKKKSASTTTEGGHLRVAEGGGQGGEDDLPPWLVHDPGSLIRVVNE